MGWHHGWRISVFVGLAAILALLFCSLGCGGEPPPESSLAQYDLDGDGIPNDQDDDIDGDGVSNEQDDDDDGDGLADDEEDDDDDDDDDDNDNDNDNNKMEQPTA